MVCNLWLPGDGGGEGEGGGAAALTLLIVEMVGGGGAAALTLLIVVRGSWCVFMSHCAHSEYVQVPVCQSCLDNAV